MQVLGISGLYHDSAAALCVDGKIIAAVQEERFTRKKADNRIPRNSINYCLSLLEGSLDAVVFYDNTALTIDRWLKGAISEPKYCQSIIEKSFDSIVSSKLWIKEHVWSIVPEEKRVNTRFYMCEHHISHAASAYYPSPFDDAAIITVDGVGEWATTTIGRGKGNNIEILKQINYPHSLGMLYSAFTYYCGFKVNTGEYKLMGLAPYGKPKYVDLIMNNLIDVKEDGSFRLNMDYFDYTHSNCMISKKFLELFDEPARVPEEKITQFYMDVAASIQKVTEDIMIKIARYAQKLTGAHNLVMAGGTALNCVVNGKLDSEGIFDNIWIQPAAGDAGGALGAAMYYEYTNNPMLVKKCEDLMQGSFLGPKYSSAYIEEWLRDNKIAYHKAEDIYCEIARFLEAKKVIGLFQGRIEYGPRALGGRSIIAQATDDEMQSRINLKIKFRESFRPFAPAVLEEQKEDYFDIKTNSPYMLLVKNVKDDLLTNVKRKCTEDLIQIVNQKRSTIPAVTHVDNSARIQTVNEKNNGYFYRVIKAYEKLSGCGVVINTSFNVRGEPIVCTPEDAYRCFMRTNMDILVLENIVLIKEEQQKWCEEADWRNVYELD